MEFKKLGSRPIDVSWWNRDVKAFVKTFNAMETFVFGDLLRTYADESKPDDERAVAGARAAIMALVGEFGVPLLTEADIPALLEGPGFMIDRVVMMAANQNRADASFKKK